MDDEQVFEDQDQPTGGEPPEDTGDEGAEPSGDEPTGDDSPAEPEKEKGVQKRIDELTRKRREAEREADYWRQQAQVAKPKEEPKEVIPPGMPAKPTVDQFDSYEDYVEAVADWRADYKLAQRDLMAQQRQVQERQQQAFEGHTQRIESAKARYQDFDDVLADARDIIMPPESLQAIVESDHSADVLYHLAKNKADAKRIAALPIHQQLKEIGKLEARFERKEDPPVKRVSKAPDPITPVAGKKEPPADHWQYENDDEWLKAERERLRKMGRLY